MYMVRRPTLNEIRTCATMVFLTAQETDRNNLVTTYALTMYVCFNANIHHYLLIEILANGTIITDHLLRFLRSVILVYPLTSITIYN